MTSLAKTAAYTTLVKDIAELEKQAEELRQFDEKLRHYADMKIKLDLDDGVKINYAKFGNALTKVPGLSVKP